MVPVDIEYRVKNPDGKPVGEPRLYYGISLATQPCIGWTITFTAEEIGRHRQLRGKVVDVDMTAGEETIKVVLEHQLVRHILGGIA